MKSKILIFIPCYNVENFVYDLVNQIPKKIFKDNYVKLLIINDCSIDKTSNEIKKIKKKFKKLVFSKHFKKNQGYGAVQKYAFKFSIKNKFDYLIMLHGDGQYLPSQIPKFIFYLKKNKYDAVFGSRMIKPKMALKGGMPLYKFVGNIFLTFLQNIILSSKISEFHSGYRSFNIKSLSKIKYKNFSNNFHFDTEIIINFLKKKNENIRNFYTNFLRIPNFTFKINSIWFKCFENNNFIKVY